MSDGALVIRDQDKQTQNLSVLSRDVEHANQTLSPIFDKEKEQKRLQQAQLIGEIGNQAMDIARTEGSIAATKAAKEKMNNVTDADRQAAAAKLAKEKPGKVITEDDINAQIYQAAYNQAFSESGYGTGGKVQQGMQAAVAAVQGLAGGDLKAAIAGGAAPYLAEQIHLLAPNEESRVIAHAVVAGALAELQGKSAAAGAAGAATAALGTKAIAEAMFGTSDFSKMSEEQRQTVSALATLAGGLAGGLASGDTAGAVAGGQSGKNTSENNDQFSLPPGMMSYGQGASTLAEQMVKEGKSSAEISSALNKYAKGDLPEGANITKVIVNGYKDGVLIAGAIYLGPAASIGKVAVSSILSGGANAAYQWYDMNQPGNENKTYDYWGTTAAAVTGGLAPGRNIPANIGIAMGGTLFTDGADPVSVGAAAGGALVGGGFGKYAPVGVTKILGDDKVPGYVYDFIGGMSSEFTSGFIKDISKPVDEKGSKK
ncbi:VENN motif pre-toxin domain-containing protein [Serratia sp. root2]|uniref:VENN motif pre-toxin domain-containing protein n=1 Tax=Serratia sp. root2 TaxID=3059676 RepID=UPI002891F781|nr:VENN motif pre-toxin domain-containing protein [Serratia sp. root2]MDT3253058.1 VENN motif pre-toxin domain-containing protein [Serratia sp. root2]